MTGPAEHRSERLFRGCELAAWADALPEGGLVAVRSLCAPGKSGSNEDAAAVIRPAPACLVLAVADGVGGHPGGEDASGVAVEAMTAAVHERLADGDGLREAILCGFDRANRAVISQAPGAATTLAVAEINAGRMRSYHVGDSGVLVFGGRGRIRLQTIFHSPVGYAFEAGVLDEEAAMAHEDRHLVSNVLGDPGMHVGMSSLLRLRPRDTVVLASDGLFDNAYIDEVVERLRRGRLEAAADALIDECRARMAAPREGLPCKPDDLTLVAYRPGGSRR